MSARKDKRPSLIHPFVDPWRKLLAFALAVALWFFLDSQVTETKELDCYLVAADSAIPRPTPNDLWPTICVQFPHEEYSLVGFEGTGLDPDEQIVKITVSGPNNVFRRKRDNEQLFVEFDPTTLRSDNSFDFDVRRVKMREDLFGLSKSAMEPKIITVRLEPNTTRRDFLQIDHVVLDTQGIKAERLIRQSARFEPEQSQLRGRKDKLDSLSLSTRPFRVTLVADREESELRGTLRLVANETTKRLQLDGSDITVRIPLRPNYVPFELMIPVQLDTTLTDYSPADFEPVPPQKVTLRAAGSLAAELEDEARRAEFVAKNLRINALLPENTKPDGVPAVQATLFFLGRTDWQLGRHYDYSIDLITIEPKKNQ